MSLIGSPIQEWGFTAGDMGDAQPSTTWGTSITFGNTGAYGSYTEVMSDTVLTEDCYWIDIIFHNGTTSAADRNQVATIGFDTAGGTTYTDIEIKDLLCSAVGALSSAMAGYRYSFPLYIPAGTAIACKGASDNTSNRSTYCMVQVYGRPKYPHLLRYGHKVESIGVSGTTATAITAGTTSDGTLTSLGTTSNTCFYWQSGIGISDTTMLNLTYSADIAADNDGTTPKIIQTGGLFHTTTAERTMYVQNPAWHEVKAGETIYGRMQCSTTPSSTLTMAAYGVY